LIFCWGKRGLFGYDILYLIPDLYQGKFTEEPTLSYLFRLRPIRTAFLRRRAAFSHPSGSTDTTAMAFLLSPPVRRSPLVCGLSSLVHRCSKRLCSIRVFPR